MKKIKILLLITFCFLVSLFGMGQNVSAASYPNKITGITKGEWLKLDGEDGLYFKSNSKYPVYCSTYKIGGVGGTCELSSKQWSLPTQAAIAAIIEKVQNGGTSVTKDKYYYAELAINQYVFKNDSLGNENSHVSSTGRGLEKVQKYLDIAKDAAKKANTPFKVLLSTKTGTIDFSEVGDYYVSNKITVSDSGGYLNNYTIDLSGHSAAKIYDQKDNTFKIRIPVSSVDVGATVKVKVKVNGTKTYSLAKRFDCGDGNQVMTPGITMPYTLSDSASLSGSVSKAKTKLKVLKIDSITKEPVAGATLTLKDSSSKVIRTWVSKTTAEVFENLEPGSYTLTEEKAPDGYIIDKGITVIYIGKDEKPVTIELENTPKTKLRISKQDVTTGKELPGASLVLKDEKGKTWKWVSTNEPHYIEGLDAGKYTLTETIAPDGYTLSTETISFELKADGKVNEQVMYNSPVTKLKISKQDATTGKELPGASLVLKNEKGKTWKWISTDEPHYIEGLDAGKYTLTETIAPDGYILSKEEVTFILEADGKVKEVTMFNTPVVKNKYMIKIRKLDATTKEDISGATLLVKDSDGNVIEEWVSDGSAHYIEVDKPGMYTLTETKAPEGYDLSYEVVKFEVVDDETVETSVVMYNSITPDTSDNIVFISLGLLLTILGTLFGIVKFKKNM